MGYTTHFNKMYQRQPLVAPLPTLTANFTVPTIEVAAWFDPLLPAPDSQYPLYAGQNRVRNLNGGSMTVDADYADYRKLYALYLEQRVPFHNKPRSIPLGDGKVPEWEDLIAQRKKELGSTPTPQRQAEFNALIAQTNQVQADYRAMWAALSDTIDKLAECNYVHDFGGSYTRILDEMRGVDVTAPKGGGMPMEGWQSVNYDRIQREYDLKKQEMHNAGIVLQTFKSHYANVDLPIPDGSTLIIVKNPATTHRYRSMLWAAVRGH